MSALILLLVMYAAFFGFVIGAYAWGFRSGRAAERDECEWRRTARELGIDTEGIDS